MKFADLEMKNPIVIASGPVTATIDQLKEAEKNGAAAVSIKQVMTRQSFRGNLRAYSVPEEVIIFPIDKRLDVEEGLALTRQAKEQTSLVVMVNLSSQEKDIEEYGRLAKRFEDVGADAIEINMCCPNFSLSKRQLGMDITEEDIETGAITGQNPKLAGEIVKVIKDYVKIPVIPKLTPTALDIGAVAEGCVRNGADGLSLVGGPSLAAPPVDIYNGGLPLYPLMDPGAFGAINGSAIRYATFKVTGQVAQRVSVPLVSSGGIDTWEHAIQMMMWGASAVSMCTSIMWRGFEVVDRIRKGMEQFLEAQGYHSYDEIVGLSLKHISSSDHLGLRPGYAQIDPAKCRNCGICTKPGHCNAVVQEQHYCRVIPERCLGCSVCVGLCPTRAITMVEAQE
jgi:dihydroorotate dehydrogenase subfamily 1